MKKLLLTTLFFCGFGSAILSVTNEHGRLTQKEIALTNTVGFISGFTVAKAHMNLYNDCLKLHLKHNSFKPSKFTFGSTALLLFVACGNSTSRITGDILLSLKDDASVPEGLVSGIQSLNKYLQK